MGSYFWNKRACDDVVFAERPSSDEIADAALRADGKIVSVGSVRLGEWQLTGITRHLADEILDESFGDGGVILAPTGSLWPTVGGRAVAIQPDGKIVVASGESSSEVRVTRYLNDGQRDPHFGNGGSASFR